MSIIPPGCTEIQIMFQFLCIRSEIQQHTRLSRAFLAPRWSWISFLMHGNKLALIRISVHPGVHTYPPRRMLKDTNHDPIQCTHAQHMTENLQWHQTPQQMEVCAVSLEMAQEATTIVLLRRDPPSLCTALWRTQHACMQASTYVNILSVCVCIHVHVCVKCICGYRIRRYTMYNCACVHI